jgi:hypothetical protein
MIPIKFYCNIDNLDFYHINFQFGFKIQKVYNCDIHNYVLPYNWVRDMNTFLSKGKKITTTLNSFQTQTQ